MARFPSGRPPHDLSGSGRRASRPVIDARRLRAAALATSIVAALVVVAGVVIARAVFRVAVAGPSGSGVFGSTTTIVWALGAFACGILATLLMALLVRTTPSPITYFSWIVGLVTAVAAVIPLRTDGPLAIRIFTALINAVVGVAIGALTVSAARRSILSVPPTEPELEPPYR